MKGLNINYIEKEFLEELSKSLDILEERILENKNNHLLILPALSPRLRYLTHQKVSFVKSLMSFSVGTEEKRRTIISRNTKLLSNEGNESKSKIKRPDQPLYIPRNQRNNSQISPFNVLDSQNMGNKDQSKTNISETTAYIQQEMYNPNCLKSSELLTNNVSEKTQKVISNIFHNNLKNNIQCLLMNINKENQNNKNTFDNKLCESDQSALQSLNLDKEISLQTDAYKLVYDQLTPCKKYNSYSQQSLKRDTAKSCPNLPTRTPVKVPPSIDKQTCLLSQIKKHLNISTEHFTNAHNFTSVSTPSHGMGDALFLKNKNNNNQYENRNNKMDDNNNTDKVCINDALSKQNKILNYRKREKFRKTTKNKNTQNKNELSIRSEDKNNIDEVTTKNNFNYCELPNADEPLVKNEVRNSSTKNNNLCNGNAEEDDDDWFNKFDDDGNALDMKSLNEIKNKLGETEMKNYKVHYFDFTPPDLYKDEYSHLLEIYDFPKELKTEDLVMAFKSYHLKGFEVKWVDDTHAVAVFSNSFTAQSALTSFSHPFIRLRCINEASKATKNKLKKSNDFSLAYKERPQVVAMVARNMLAGALGIKSSISREKREEEKNIIKEAKEKKKSVQKMRTDAWEGKF